MALNKTFLASILLLSTSFIIVPSSLLAETIHIATEGKWAPFNYIDASGQPQGFDIDIANALCEKMEVKCDIVTQEWNDLIPGLKVRKYDAIVASMSITEDRLKVVDFTDKYYSSGLRFVGHIGMPFTPDNVQGKRIGALRNSLASQYLEKNYTDKDSLYFYDDQNEVYRALVNGDLDLILSDELPTYDWLRQSRHDATFEFKGKAFMKNDEIAIAVRQGDKLKDKFNQALKQILSDGTYQRINAKYFPFSIY